MSSKSGDTPRISRRISSRACDHCRARKVQCVFEDPNSVGCRRCSRRNVECTFLQGHHPRGPRPQTFEPATPPLMKIDIQHLCSTTVLHQLVDDYDDFVYPLIPLIERESFRKKLEAGVYNTEPAFLRQCFSLCALTVASAPNKEQEYCTGSYKTYQSFVSRACDLALMSRLATLPDWQDNPSPSLAVETAILSLAAHYAGQERRGWALSNEGMLMLKDLQIHREEGLARLSSLDRELCKRAFWVLHSTQMQVLLAHSKTEVHFADTQSCSYDAFISSTPHVLSGFPPRNTQWLSLDLAATPENDGQRPSLETLEAFHGTTKLFTCIRHLLATDKYRACLVSLVPFFESLETLATRSVAINTTKEPSFSDRLTVAYEISEQLHRCVRETVLPDDSLESKLTRGQEVAHATLEVNCVYLTNCFIETIFHDSADFWNVNSQGSHRPHSPDEVLELWRLREALALRLLDILTRHPLSVLELNGFSLIHQIRKVAASLVDYHAEPATDSMLDGKPKLLLDRFSSILASLDLNLAVSSMLHVGYPDLDDILGTEEQFT